MASILKVDTIQDQSGNNIINENANTITIGASGDTVTIPSGASITLTDGVSGDFKMNSGFGSAATAYGCRAWVNFNGVGTVAVRASGNVSSISDNGTGDYTVNFTTAMPDSDFCTIATGGGGGAGNLRCVTGLETLYTTSASRFQSTSSNGTLVDADVFVSIFR